MGVSRVNKMRSLFRFYIKNLIVSIIHNFYYNVFKLGDSRVIVPSANVRGAFIQLKQVIKSDIGFMRERPINFIKVFLRN